MGSPETPQGQHSFQAFEGLLGASPARPASDVAQTPQQVGTPGRWDQCQSSPSSWGTPGKSFNSLSMRGGAASPGSAGSPCFGQRSPTLSGKGSPEQGTGRGKGRGAGRGFNGKGWPPKRRPEGSAGSDAKPEDGEATEAACPRAKDEIFEELKKVLEGNSALQFAHFDARVRQHLHALHHAGGRARVREALGMIHSATMQKTRQDVKNWPAYLLTLLKKFDADQGSHDREARARQRIAAAAEKTSPGKSSSGEDGADALDLSPDKAPLWEDDEREVPSAPPKTGSAGSWYRSAAAVAVAGLAAAAWGTSMPEESAAVSSVRMPTGPQVVPPPPNLPPPGPPLIARDAHGYRVPSDYPTTAPYSAVTSTLRQPLTAPPSTSPQFGASPKPPGHPPVSPPTLPPTAPPTAPPRNVGGTVGSQQVFGTAPTWEGRSPELGGYKVPPRSKTGPPPTAPPVVAAR